MATPNNPIQSGYAYLFKCSFLAALLFVLTSQDIIIGDTGVGKSCLLLQFTDKVCTSSVLAVILIFLAEVSAGP